MTTPEHYSKWLIRSKDGLVNVTGYDEELLKHESIKDRSLANMLLGGLYARYAMAVQDLDNCFDQLIQVQKNFTLRKIMDAAVKRLYELKEELTKLDISEYHYIDGALIELKLVPYDIAFLHPTLVCPRDPTAESLWQRLKDGEDIYDPADGGLEDTEEDAVKKEKKKKKKAAAVDVMAMLNANAGQDQAGVEEEEALHEEMVVEEEEAAKVDEDIEYDEDGIPIKKRIKKQRPCNRPKVASQLEAEMSAEEKAELYRKVSHLAAIVMIQAHERARQSRLYVHDVLHVSAAPAPSVRFSATGPKHDSSEELLPVDPRTGPCVRIQSWWRRYLDEERERRRELRLQLVIGMVIPSYKSNEEMTSFRKSLWKRRALRYQALADYYQTLLDEKARVLRVIAPGLFEDIGDEIRQWFKDWFYTCKVFKDIPPAAEGGTVVIMRGDIETPEEHFQEMLKKGGIEAAKAKAKADALKAAAAAKKAEDAKKKSEAAKKAKEKEKAKKKRATEYEFAPTRTDAMEAIAEGMEEYEEHWAHRDDAEHPEMKPFMEPITDRMCYEVQLEVRKKVDEVMRLELEILKGSLEKLKWLQKGGKGKFKPKKPKKEKKAKEKGEGKKGKKKKKDLTGKRRTEDLFQEMFQKGIIRTYPEVHLDDFVYDYSYQNYEKREAFYDPPATLGDAHQAVIVNCIVPLGATSMVRPKSVLVAGPRNSGLEVLANAVFNETQCVLFDLSPANLTGKYPGKAGQKQLTHLVTKMSVLLQPSIIYVGDAEKAFYKKVPKEEKAMDPKRLGKFLGKIIKAITPDDRVLVLATSYFPFLAQPAKLKKLFPTVILVPRVDYGSCFMIWQRALMPYHGVDRNFNLTALATLSRYYPAESIEQAVRAVLQPRRIVQLHYRPLEAVELIDALRDCPGPVDDKEWAKYIKFYNGTKLGKERKKLTDAFTTLREAAAKKAGKGKKR